MKNETKTSNKQKDKIKDIDDFTKDIVQMRSENKERKILISLIFLVLLVFSGLGISYYQIFIKPDKYVPTVSSESKIESKPTIDEKAEEKKEEEKPAETEPVTQPEPTTNSSTTTPSVTEYTVQSGDTWSSIANSNGMTSKQLMDYNGASNEDLQIGQKIKIPNE